VDAPAKQSKASERCHDSLEGEEVADRVEREVDGDEGGGREEDEAEEVAAVDPAEILVQRGDRWPDGAKENIDAISADARLHAVPVEGKRSVVAEAEPNRPTHQMQAIAALLKTGQSPPSTPNDARMYAGKMTW
jgi:hypothetical protein